MKGPRRDITGLIIYAIAAVMIMLCFVMISATDAHAGKHFGYNNPSPGMIKANVTHANSNNAVSESNSHGGQAQQAQGQVNEDLVNVDLSDHSSNYIDAERFPVNTAVAPGLVAGGDEMCVGSASGAIQSTVIGISGGSTKESAQCNRRRNATKMAQIAEVRARFGDTVGAIRGLNASRALLCQDADMAEAYASVGVNCAEGGLITVQSVKRGKFVTVDAREAERNRRKQWYIDRGWGGNKSGGFNSPDGN